ncbi:MAG TPA: histidine phosphatase family protein, partial [Polyangiaceae bacterium]|nr:histidine phosphatase family protein [Polyangiaceae bacterium]
IRRGRKLTLAIEPWLRERDMGTLTGASFDKVRERHPEFWQKLLARDPQAAPPNGESHAALASRVGRTLEAILPRHRGLTLALVAHGGTIAHATRLLLGVEDMSLSFWVAADNASVTRVDQVEPIEGVFLPRLAYANRVAVCEGDAFLKTGATLGANRGGASRAPSDVSAPALGAARLRMARVFLRPRGPRAPARARRRRARPRRGAPAVRDLAARGA